MASYWIHSVAMVDYVLCHMFCLCSMCCYNITSRFRDPLSRFRDLTRLAACSTLTAMPMVADKRWMDEMATDNLNWTDLTAIEETSPLFKAARDLMTARTKFEGLVRSTHPEAAFSYKRGQCSYGINPAVVTKPANGKAGKPTTPEALAALIAKAVAAAMAAQGLTG